MASSSGDEEWVYVDEDSKAASVEASSADSSGGKDGDNDTSGTTSSASAEVASVDGGATEKAAAEVAAGDGGELPTGGATATSEVVDADVTAQEEDGGPYKDDEAVGSDYEASSYGATDVDDYLEYEEDDIAEGVASIKINVEATPPIFLDDDDFAPVDAGADAAEEAPAKPRFVPSPYMYPSYGYDCGDGAYYGRQYQYQYLATYYPSHYLPPPVTYAHTEYPYAYAPPPAPPKD